MPLWQFFYPDRSFLPILENLPKFNTFEMVTKIYQNMLFQTLFHICGHKLFAELYMELPASWRTKKTEMAKNSQSERVRCKIRDAERRGW